MLKHGILGLLNYGEMSGYEIKSVFEDSLKHFWQAQTSQIYRELQVLEKNGWISATHVAQEGRPDKNILSITDEGRAELMNWLEGETESSVMRNPMLMKVFFRGECSIDENIEFFKSLPERECMVKAESKELEKTTEEYRTGVDDPLKALYWKFTIDFGVMYGNMVREWSENCVRELEKIKEQQNIRKK
ncbi:MAG: PadR family transcriptional regulator [Lachnospiraceae bacterium]|nr:PadR family transcriptional regulator [Lachnospiraceae bacterium]